MKKKILFIILFLFLLVPALGYYDICQEEIETNSNCSYITPVLSCDTYTYDIINITGLKIVDNSTLTHLNSSIYVFNFSQAEGNYVVRLCDNTTSTVQVTQEDSNKMIIAVIILLPMLLAFIFMMAANSLGEEHTVLKIALFLICPFLFLLSAGLGIQAVGKFYNFSPFIENIATTNYWLTWFFVVIIIYFLIYLFTKITHKIGENKKEEGLEY